MGTALEGGEGAKLDTGSKGSMKRLESFDGKSKPNCGFQMDFLINK